MFSENLCDHIFNFTLIRFIYTVRHLQCGKIIKAHIVEVFELIL